jgi:hypothetical protein
MQVVTLSLLDTICKAFWASPKAKAGMFRLHFGQVHRITVVGTILMGRGRALLDQGQGLARSGNTLRDYCNGRNKETLAGVDRPILIYGNIGKAIWNGVRSRVGESLPHRREWAWGSSSHTRKEAMANAQVRRMWMSGEKCYRKRP